MENNKTSENNSNSKIYIIFGILLLSTICVFLCICLLSFRVIASFGGSLTGVEFDNLSGNQNQIDDSFNFDLNLDDNSVELKIDNKQPDSFTLNVKQSFDKLKQNNPEPNFPFVVTSIDDDPMLGSLEDATYAIVEFQDFECPYCEKFHSQTFPDIKSKLLADNPIIFVNRDFPLSFHDPTATELAILAECVGEFTNDDFYFETIDFIFKNSGLNGSGIDKSVIEEYLRDNRLFTSKMEICRADADSKREINNDIDAAKEINITGTPGFVIGYLDQSGYVYGYQVSGAYPYETFEKLFNNLEKNFVE